MKRRWVKISLIIPAVVLVVGLLLTLLPARVNISTDGNVSITLGTYDVLASPSEVTYYFDVYDVGTVWETTPQYMVDNNILTNYASTNNDNEQEKLTETTGPGTDLGTITKVELRAYGYGDGNDRIDFSFDSSQIPEYQLTMPSSPGWSLYANVTADSNVGGWTWAKVQDPTPDLWVQYDKSAGGNVLYCAKVEIRITYGTGEPKGGSVVFVRVTEGAITNTVLTLNIEVSVGTDRVLVVGLAYKSGGAVAPTSILFNTSEGFVLEKTALDGGDAQCFMYYLVAPTETTADVVITMPGTVRMVGYVAYFTGVDQSSPFTANTTEAQGTDAVPTVDLTSAADEIAIDIMVQVSGGPDTITSNTGTKICDGAATGGGSDTRGGGQYDTGATPVTMGYTTSGADNWNIIAGALQEPVADPVITSAPDTWTLNGIIESGAIIPDTIYYANPQGDTQAPASTVADADCRFTVTNTSAMAIDLTCTMGAFTGGDGDMTNSDDGSNGATTYGAYSWFSGQLYANKVIIKSSGSSVGYDGLAATTDIMWGAEVETRTNAWTGGSASTAILTITATVD